MLKRKREEYKIIKKLPRKEAFFVGKELIEMFNSIAKSLFNYLCFYKN
jgi:hypothetical protein